MLKNLGKSISYRHILLANDVARSGFIKVYQIAFAGPPYFEVYTDDDVGQGGLDSSCTALHCSS